MGQVRADTALHISCANGTLNTIILLVEGGANLEHHAEADGFTPLMRCCENKHTECARYLLDNGANANAQDRWGHTPLHWALIHHEPLADLLVERGAKACPWRCAKCETNLKKQGERRGRAGKREEKRQQAAALQAPASSASSPAAPVDVGDASAVSTSLPANDGAASAGGNPAQSAGASTAPTTPPKAGGKSSKHKSGGKSGGGGGKSSGGGGGGSGGVAHGDLIAQLGLPTHRPLRKEELDRLDVARCKQIFNNDPEPSWIAFTPVEAKWINFSVDPRMSSVFDELAKLREERGPEQQELIVDWMCRAETVLHEWIVRAIVQSEKRAACFRSLGRGWIFIQLSSHGERLNKGIAMEALNHRTRFKWWFEGVERIVRNRSSEFHTTLNLPAGEVDKWLYGYQINAEIVFVLRGMAPAHATMSRRKWRADYYKQHIWASNDQIERELEMPILDEDQRQALATKAERERDKRKAKRERQKQRKQEAAGQDREAQRQEEEAAEAREATDAFDSLLQELKMEEAMESSRQVPAAAS